MFLNKTTKIITIVLVIIFFIWDRIFKFYALKSTIATGAVSIIGNLLTFQLAKNANIAFSLSIFNGFALGAIILLIIAVMTGVLIFYKKDFLNRLIIFTILLGAVSNYYDRLRYGYVVDYFDLKYLFVFNVADAMIVIGSILLIYRMYVRGK